MRRSGSARVAALAIATLVGSACGGADSPASEGSGTGEPVSGGTVTYMVHAEGRSLDPTDWASATAASGDGPRGFAIYDALLTTDPETGEAQPRLAESLESDDNVTWTMTLKDGVEFSDGTPYDAEAVRFNWERHANPSNASPIAAAVAPITEMTAVDATTLRIVLDGPNSAFPEHVATYLPFIGSPTAMEERGDDFGSDPVGAGPFVVDEWTRDSQLVLQRNPNYWDAPRPYVDELILGVVVDEDQRFNTVSTGAAQIGHFPTPHIRARAEGAGLESLTIVPNGGRYVLLNNNEPPLNDARIRRALFLALDRDELAETVEQGEGIVVDNYFTDGSPFHDDSFGLPEHDAEEAQALIDDYVADTGDPAAVTITLSESSQPYAEAIQAQLRRLDGLEVMDQATYITRMFGHEIQAGMSSLSFLDPQPAFVEMFESGNRRNLNNFASDEVDEALAAFGDARSQADQVEAIGQVQQVLVDEMPMVPYLRFQFGVVYQPQLHDVEVFGEAIPYFDRMWLDQ